MISLKKTDLMIFDLEIFFFHETKIVVEILFITLICSKLYL